MSKVTSNYPVIVAKLKRLPAALRPVIARSLKKALEAVSGVSQKEYLSGPRPGRLGTVTTRLRNSIATKVSDSGKEFVGRIGTNVKYGAYHEFGFRGTQTVRAHTRVMGTIGSMGGIEKLNRKPIRTLDGKIVGYKRSGKVAAGLTGKAVAVQFVRGHQRKVNYAGRPFVKPALNRMRGQIVSTIEGDLARALASENKM